MSGVKKPPVVGVQALPITSAMTKTAAKITPAVAVPVRIPAPPPPPPPPPPPVDPDAATIEAMEGLLQILALHLKFLREDVTPDWMALTPSDDNLFIYRSADDGVIRTQQDAAFMCEAIIVVGKVMFNDVNIGSGTPNVTTESRSFLSLSIRDAAPGRFVTQATSAKQSVERPATVGTAATLNINIAQSVRVPTQAFIPLGNNIPFQLPEVNSDYFYRLPSLWQLPRGAAVQTEFFDKFNTVQVPAEPGAGTLPRVILCGHKVYA